MMAGSSWPILECLPSTSNTSYCYRGLPVGPARFVISISLKVRFLPTFQLNFSCSMQHSIYLDSRLSVSPRLIMAKFCNHPLMEQNCSWFCSFSIISVFSVRRSSRNLGPIPTLYCAVSSHLVFGYLEILIVFKSRC
jgi:hypothetical protein